MWYCLDKKKFGMIIFIVGVTFIIPFSFTFIKAPPRKPTIQTQNIIISGTFHSFTCSSVSTSTPAPGLPLSYEWSVNHVRILDPRFAVAGTRGETLTLNKVQKQDNGTVLYCTVMEEKGLNSEMSDQEMLNVLCKAHILQRKEISKKQNCFVLFLTSLLIK